MRSINLDFLSEQGQHVALMAIANSAGNSAASKALGEINAELRALQDPEGKEGEKTAIDKFNEFMETIHEQENPLAEHPALKNGSERQVPFIEYCVLLGAVNDKIISVARAGTGTWPVPATADTIVEWKCKATVAGVREDEVATYKLLMEAYRPGSSTLIDDAMIHKMIEEDNINKANVFSEMFTTHKAEIILRMNQAIRMYETKADVPWESLFDALPARIRLGMLKGIDGRIEGTIKRIFTGKKSDGTSAASAKRAMLDRIADIAELRGDQAKLRVILKDYADEEAGPEALGSKSGVPGTSAPGAVPSAGPALEPKEEVGTRQVSSTEFRGSKPKPASTEALKNLEAQFTH